MHDTGPGGVGTTSACAENTIMALTGCFSTRNYLRVRGEYFGEHGFFPHGAELPPRARRIQPFIRVRDKPLGTTSACAENTTSRVTPTNHPRNYLRVRGEYT